jgi:ubiquinone/menaquinone biosynthesis C-methylase UbiE
MRSHSTTSLDPRALYQIATGYWSSAVLLAANELGLFGAVADGAQTVPEVARVLHTHPRTTEILLDACVALELLRKQEDHYYLTSTCSFLVPGCPGYLGQALRWCLDQYPVWGRLADAVRTGCPITEPELHLGRDPAQTRRFVLAMHERAAGMARGVVPYLDLTDCTTLLDVGGGPGTYAGLLVERYPGLQATILDLPPVCAVASELLAGTGLDKHIVLQPGDATQADYGSQVYDAVLFCGVLHQMSPSIIRQMLVGAHQALRRGGRILICDLMLDRTKTRPVFSALFSLQMILTSQTGAVFATEECIAWLQEVGFVNVTSHSLAPALPYTVVRADCSRPDPQLGSQ